MKLNNAAVLCLLVATVSGSAIPIWELLTHQEKMGRLMYVFIHLVDQYCAQSNIPDCQKILTLYGMSNLVNEEERDLDAMDPYQRDSKNIIWNKVMKGDFKLPAQKIFHHDSNGATLAEDDEQGNEVIDGPIMQSAIKLTSNDPHPYAVRVAAPAKILAAYASPPATTSSATAQRMGRIGTPVRSTFQRMQSMSRGRGTNNGSPSRSVPMLSRNKRSFLFSADEMDEILSHVNSFHPTQ